MAQNGSMMIVIAAPKGGVGKSTLTMALLVSAAKSGLRVLGVDADSQGTLKKWYARRERQRAKPNSTLVAVPVQELAIDNYRKLRDVTGVDLIIVDTPPGHSNDLTSVRALCQLADLVLIPTKASVIDTDEVGPFGAEVSLHSNAHFVLNEVNRRARSYHERRTYLVKKGDVCPADVPRLESISAQYPRGLACTDDGEPGAADFEALFHFACRQMGLKIPSGLEVTHG
jgi:chromosome partitioning protein